MGALPNFILKINGYKVWIVILVGLFITSFYNYLFFHVVIEGFTVIIAFLIYVLGTRTYKNSHNNLLLFLGIAYFFIGIIDFYHLITYKGMGIFPHYSTNHPTQLWIVGRYVESLSLLISTFFINRQFSNEIVFYAYGAITSVLLSAILWFDLFPDCFIDGVGLTSFKIISEYLICFLLIVTFFRIYKEKNNLNQAIAQVLFGTVGITVLSELSFTLYTDIYGIINGIGHILKFIAYSLIYKGIVIIGLESPYEIMNQQIKTTSMIDYLTRLYNRHGFFELVQKELLYNKQKFSILMMDLDNFKEINDHHGHAAGDQVLQGFAAKLRSAVRKNDIVARFGGDEFCIFTTENETGANNIKNRIIELVKEWAAQDELVTHLDVSIGIATWQGDQPLILSSIIEAADHLMYTEKKIKKNQQVLKS